ncbi:tyrosine-type recombinase/integrase [Roseateles toxinivorans]|uniref:Integrase n=1 Tax=Roseateles toxinivorans TaxID=270368 RepID=A0A4R6QIT6_9BURK|nr:site-specific integrase [Roseateles toxinivorans]TDP62108.1 integrase [Roseateles toxinivorans]
MTDRVTDKKLLASRASGATTRGVGDGLTFVSSPRSAALGKASWVLRYRVAGLQRELTLGRYPDLTLKAARELARQKRLLVQHGIDVAVQKQVEKLAILEQHNVSGLAQAWYERHIANRLKHPGVVERVIRNYIKPTIGKLPISEVRPAHIDLVLARIVAAGAPTVANEALRYLFRMFHFAAKRRWIEGNPVAGFDLSDAGGSESPRKRWLSRDELGALLDAMPATDSFSRQRELAVLLLLALCVRKMELLGAKWSDFDLERSVWSLHQSRTKTEQTIQIPLCPAVITWLHELRVFAAGSPYLFPSRLQIRVRNGVARSNRFGHISPDRLNLALKRLPMPGVKHFTVHHMRRTARTHLAGMGIDWHIAERVLSHKLAGTQGIYDLHDYFTERRMALSK